MKKKTIENELKQPVMSTVIFVKYIYFYIFSKFRRKSPKAFQFFGTKDSTDFSGINYLALA